LFAAIEPDSVFDDALLNFFGGDRDQHSLALLQLQR